MGEKVEDDQISKQCIPIYVSRCHHDRWTTAHAVPRKGEDPHAIQVAANDLELSGYTDFVYKSDGEASIKALKRRAVVELRRRVGEVRVQYEEAGTGE